MSKTLKTGAAVFCNAANQLRLVEVNVRAELESGMTSIHRFDEREAERVGAEILERERPGEGWAYVGTLFAEVRGKLTLGRINWGTDFERVEVFA